MEEQSTSATGFKFTKKTVIGLIVLVLLVAAIPIGVYLSQQKQLFKPKADEIKPNTTPETSLTLTAPASVEPGKEIRVSLAIRSDIDASNLLVAKLKFPTDLLEVLSISTGTNSSLNLLSSDMQKGTITVPQKVQWFESGTYVLSGNGDGVDIQADEWSSDNKTFIGSHFASSSIFTVSSGNHVVTIIRLKKGVNSGTYSEVSLIDGSAVSSTGIVKNWIEKVFDNLAGTVSLSGGIPDPGYKSTVGKPSDLIAEIVFKAKKAGSSTISFDTDSAIYRNSDNINILNIKRDASFKIENQVVPIFPTLTLTPTSVPSNQNLVFNGDFSRGDSGWDFWGNGRAIAGPGQHLIENGLLVVQDGGAQQKITLLPNTTYKLVATVRNSTAITKLNAPSSGVVLFSETTEAIRKMGEELVFLSNTPETKETVFTTSSITTYNLSMGKAVDGIDAAYFDDIGIYKVNSLPSTSPTPTSSGIKGDVNGDGKITLVDMSVFYSKWGKTGAEAGKADINGDGKVNTFDYKPLIDILTQNGVIKTQCAPGLPYC